MAKTPFPDNPRAFMGFVGFVEINGFIVRATSADINVTQEITKPDVVDSRYDRSVYQLGPQLVDGSISFPVVYESSGGTTLFEVLYKLAVQRDANGELSPFDINVKYAASTAFKYVGCVVNTWKFSVAQSDVVTCDFDIVGLAREAGALTTPTSEQVGTTRIVTWNDANVAIATTGGGTVGGEHIRTFDCNINNDVERFYSLNTVLAPQHISPRKRDITGSMTVMGRHDSLASTALANELNCTESSTIDFGYVTNSTGEGCSDSTFAVTLPNVVFEIETMSLTNDIFESTVAYHSLPGAGTGITDPLLIGIS